LFEYAQHLRQFMSALQYLAACGDDAIGTLLARKLWVLLYTIEGYLAGAPENGEYRSVFRGAHRIIAPLAFGDLAPIDGEDGVKLGAIEADFGLPRRGGRWRGRNEAQRRYVILPAGSVKRPVWHAGRPFFCFGSVTHTSRMAWQQHDIRTVNRTRLARRKDKVFCGFLLGGPCTMTPQCCLVSALRQPHYPSILSP